MMKFLTMALGSMLGLVVPLGFILACSLILDRPNTIFIVGLVFGFAATYALAVLTEGKKVEPIMIDDRWNVVMPVSILCMSVAIILGGIYMYVSDRPYYLSYREVPHIAAAMIFLPGALVGCGLILCILAGSAFVTEVQRREVS